MGVPRGADNELDCELKLVSSTTDVFELESLLCEAQGARSRPGARLTRKKVLHFCRSNIKTISLVLLLAVLLAIFTGAYAVSLLSMIDPQLRGYVSMGDFRGPAYDMLGAVALGTAAIWLAALTCSRVIAAAVCGALCFIVLLFLAFWHGSNFQDHGLLNFVAFLLLFLPLNAVLLAVWGLWKVAGSRRFPYVLAAVLLSTTLVVALRLVHYRRQWGRGFYGHSIDTSPPYCNFPPNLPWIDLLPAGAANFWAPTVCKAAEGFDAAFGKEDGLLVISGCPPHKPAEYTPFPTTKGWPADDRSSWEMPRAVQKRLVAYPYLGPVELRGTEVVLARCGDAERLLVRVAAQPSADTHSQAAAADNSTAQDAAAAQLLSSEGSNDTEAPAGSGPAGGIQAGNITADPDEEGLDAAAGNGDGNSTAQAVSPAQPSSGDSSSGGEAPPSNGTAAGAAAPHLRSATAGPEDQPLNVLMIFIDALQRRHMFRRLPKTVAALEALPATSGGATNLYQFFRHHIVGLNTAYNSFPVFTGTYFSWNGTHRGSQPVWESYRRQGYVLGTANSACQGWGWRYNKKPTRFDHELISPFCLPEYQPSDDETGVFTGYSSIRPRCLRGRLAHGYNLEYNAAFLKAYDDLRPWFFLNWFYEQHESTGEVVATLDDDLAAFLQGLSPTLLNRTAVVLYADHGLHMGLNFLFTKNGAVEHANPFLALLLPDWLKERHPAAAAALAANEQSLISAYDVFTTLHHLLHLHEGDDTGSSAAPSQETLAAWAAAGGLNQEAQWGLSLLAPIPAGRTCAEAQVSEEWCMCHHSSEP